MLNFIDIHKDQRVGSLLGGLYSRDKKETMRGGPVLWTTNRFRV